MIWDVIREKLLQARPEEKLRQKLLEILVEDFGFPSHYLVIEAALSTLPHLLKQKRIPARRIDILCYLPQQSNYIPLLLIECKAGKISSACRRQVLGYNHYVRAPFLSIVSPEEALFLDVNTGKWAKVFPSFSELLSLYKKRETQKA